MTIDMPLKCSVEGDEIVFRLGLDTLVMAAENCPEMFDNNERPFPPYVKVVDAKRLAQDVAHKLNREAEDGMTPIAEMIDRAIVDAWEDGSEGFEEEV